MTTEMSRKTHRFILRFAGIATALATLLIFYVPVADACDSCNRAFGNEIQNERAETLTGKDLLLAMDNHAKIPALRREGAVAMQTDRAPTGQPVAAARQEVSEPQGAAQIYAEDEPFLEVIERDESLSTPPTSYVSQDATPDVTFTVELNEGQTYIGQGVVYDGLLMDGSVPGQEIRVTQGDVVEMRIKNSGVIPHGASIHSAYTQTSKYVGSVDPGQTKSVIFRVNHPGVYMYHCAPGGHAIPMHVIGGQYGMMIVEPRETPYRLEEELGHGPDVTINLLQHEFYDSGKSAIDGAALYTAFNGRVFRYVEEPIVVHPGDYVRINYLNVGPQNVSTFHIVGIVWDYVYWQGNPKNIMHGGQTVTSGPSDSWVIEFRAPPDEGAYLMLDHSVGNTSRGAIGVLAVDSSAERTGSVIGSQGPVFSREEMTDFESNANRIINPFGIGTAPSDLPVVYGPEVEEVRVQIIGNSYYPKVIEVAPGTKVTWSNEEVFTYMDGEFSGIHNAVGISGPERFATGLLAHAETESVVFTEPGEYEYMCTPHPYMRGMVIVREGTTSEEPAEKSGCSSTSGTPGGAMWIVLVMVAGIAFVRRRRRLEV